MVAGDSGSFIRLLRKFLDVVRRTADQPDLQRQEPAAGQYQVFVDDHFHYQDESHRYLDGHFSTYDEAVERCRAIVDSDLEDALKPGMTFKDLFEKYSFFGLDPFIKTPPELRVDPPFSSWNYAQEQCRALTSSAEIPKA